MPSPPGVLLRMLFDWRQLPYCHDNSIYQHNHCGRIISRFRLNFPAKICEFGLLGCSWPGTGHNAGASREQTLSRVGFTGFRFQVSVFSKLFLPEITISTFNSGLWTLDSRLPFTSVCQQPPRRADIAASCPQTAQKSGTGNRRSWPAPDRDELR